MTYSQSNPYCTGVLHIAPVMLSSLSLSGMSLLSAFAESIRPIHLHSAQCYCTSHMSLLPRIGCMGRVRMPALPTYTQSSYCRIQTHYLCIHPFHALPGPL